MIKEDLTGKHFGLLTVEKYNPETKKWICKCECGKTTEVLSYNLRLGNTKSCGHLKNSKGIKRARPTNIMNEKIGQLLVTDVNDVTNLAKVKCLQCGRVTTMKKEDLVAMKKTRKRSYTCGIDGCTYKSDKLIASKIKNRTRFGKLVVLKRIDNKVIKTKKSTTSIPMYLCKCDCGNEIEVQGRYLLDGRTKSCGCLRSKNFQDRNNKTNINNSLTDKKLLQIYTKWQRKYIQPTKIFQKNIIDKNIKFFPELKSVENPFEAFCNWAKLNNFDLKTNRIYLDRLDYKKDFSTNNCFWSDVKTRGY